jgi:hypothetical protein
MHDDLLPVVGLLAIAIFWLVPSKFLGAGSYATAFGLAAIFSFFTQPKPFEDWHSWRYAALGCAFLVFWTRKQTKREE